MIMTFWEYFLRKWRRWKHSPDMMLQVMVFTIIVGATLYIGSLVYQRHLYKARLEIDYYDEPRKPRKRVEAFEPKLFKEFDRPEILMGSNFEFSLNVPHPSSWCRNKNKTGPGRTMLVMVSSPIKHVSHRTLIRNTWGSLHRIRDWEMKVIFMLEGQEELDPMPEDLVSQIQDEYDVYKDMVIGSFPDKKPSEYELSQHLMSYKWALTYCSNANFLLRAVDTTFVDIFQIMEKITHAVPRKTLICGINTGTETSRIGKKKKESAALPATSNYCNPHAMILSMDVVERIYFLRNDNHPRGVGRKKRQRGKSSKREFQEDESLSSSSDRKNEGTKSIYLGKKAVQNILTGQEMRGFMDIRALNVAHKFLYSVESAIKWGRNGKFTRDQKPSWCFLILPKKLPSEMSKSVRKLWKKIVIVNALVFEFKLHPHARIGKKDALKIEKNMKSAVVKLKESQS